MLTDGASLFALRAPSTKHHQVMGPVHLDPVY